MSIHTKVSQWRNVARFCSSRAVDYAELLALELDEAKARLQNALQVRGITLRQGKLFG